MEMDNLKWEREQLLFDKERAESDRDNLQFERDLAEIENKNTFPEVGYKKSPVARRKPSFMQRAFTAAAVYHFFKKLF